MQRSRGRGHSFLTLYECFREVALPRPLPNPPEYVNSFGNQNVSIFSRLEKLRQGFSIYLNTWRQAEEQTEVQLSLEQRDQSKTEAVSPSLQHEYGVRMRALQGALKEFVKGFQEGSMSR